MKYVIRHENGIIYAKYMTTRDVLTEIEGEITEDEFALIDVPCTAEYKDGRIVKTVPCDAPEVAGDIHQSTPQNPTALSPDEERDAMLLDLDYRITLLENGGI